MDIIGWLYYQWDEKTSAVWFHLNLELEIVIFIETEQKLYHQGLREEQSLEKDFLLILVQLEEGVLVIYYTMCLILISRHFQIIKNRF